MSKLCPDRHPKIRGKHSILDQYRRLIQRMEQDDKVISITPQEIKKEPEHDRTRCKKAQKKLMQGVIHRSQDPVVEIVFYFGHLCQTIIFRVRRLEVLEEYLTPAVTDDNAA